MMGTRNNSTRLVRSQTKDSSGSALRASHPNDESVLVTLMDEAKNNKSAGNRPARLILRYNSEENGSVESKLVFGNHN